MGGIYHLAEEPERCRMSLDLTPTRDGVIAAALNVLDSGRFQADLWPVDIHREAMMAAARLMLARKLVSVLS